MSNFKVELCLETSESPEKDTVLVAEVSAENESQALSEAKRTLHLSNPALNLAKVWCWHIEKICA